jgi:hypothetical protein
MFGRDARCKLSDLLIPRLRYLGDSNAMLSLNVLHAVYWIVLENQRRLLLQKKGQDVRTSPFRENELVFVKVHTAKAFDDRYHDPHRVLKVFKAQLLLLNAKGEKITVDKTQVRRVPLLQSMIACLPRTRRAQRGSRYHIDPNSVPPPINLSSTKRGGSPEVQQRKSKDNAGHSSAE